MATYGLQMIPGAGLRVGTAPAFPSAYSGEGIFRIAIIFDNFDSYQALKDQSGTSRGQLDLEDASTLKFRLSGSASQVTLNPPLSVNTLHVFDVESDGTTFTRVKINGTIVHTETASGGVGFSAIGANVLSTSDVTYSSTVSGKIAWIEYSSGGGPVFRFENTTGTGDVFPMVGSSTEALEIDNIPTGNAKWVLLDAAEPTVTTTDTLQPGEAFTLTATNFASAPVSPVTLTDSQGSTITVPVTISGSGPYTAVGTMPTLAEAVTAGTSLLFGDVTIELTT